MAVRAVAIIIADLVRALRTVGGTIVGFDDLSSRADHATRHLDMTPPATSATALVPRLGPFLWAIHRFKNRPLFGEPFSGWRIVLPPRWDIPRLGRHR